MNERMVLAYTGGLQTSMAIRSLAEADDAEVVTLTLDLWQRRDLEEIRDRALATGAARVHVLDVREAFAHDFGVDMPLTELIESLSSIAGQHGVGWIEEEESNVTGAQIRHVHEAPAAVVLHAAVPRK